MEEDNLRICLVKHLRYVENVLSNESLKTFRFIFKHKVRTDIDNILNQCFGKCLLKQLKDTPIYPLLLKFAKNLQKFRINLSDKGLFPPIKSMILTTSELWNLYYKFLIRIEAHNLVGKENCRILATYFADKYRKNITEHIPDILHNVAPISRIFRSKSLGKKFIDQKEKRRVQLNLVNNAWLSLHFLIIFFQRSCTIKKLEKKPNNNYVVTIYWRTEFLKNVRKEIYLFKRQHNANRIKTDVPSVCCAQFNISTKGLKMRPIFIMKKENTIHQWNTVALISSIIDYVMEGGGPYQEILSIQEILEELLDFRRNAGREQVYMAKLDYSKFFCSIEHRKMFNIFMQFIPKQLFFFCSAWAKKIRKSGEKYWKFFGIGESIKTARMDVDRRIADKQFEYVREIDYELITSKDIERSIISVLKGYYVVINKKVYRLRHGLPQGHPLSTKLAHIYANHYETSILKDHFNPNILWVRRYVDDYLFCSTRKLYLEKIIDLFTNDTNEYGLTINKSKMKVGWKSRSDAIEWCGYNIYYNCSHIRSMNTGKVLTCHNKRLEHYPLARLLGKLTRYKMQTERGQKILRSTLLSLKDL